MSADTWTRQKSSYWQRGRTSPQIERGVGAASMWHRPRSPSNLKSAPVGQGQTPFSLSCVEDMAWVKRSGCCWRTRCELGITSYQGPAA